MYKASGPQGQHSFSNIPQADIPRSSFDRSCGIKTTFDAGFLVPIFADEALPGDTIKLQPTVFARLATPIFPILDNMILETHFWAVPLRLVWDNFVKFMGEQTNPGDSTDFQTPLVNSPLNGFARGSLADYLGYPPQASDGSVGFMTAFWHRGYNLIYNEWYRDQNLQNSVSVPKTDGPDADTLYPLLRRGKRKDYFSGSLPFAQKGTAVSLPLGTTAPVTGGTITGIGTNAPTFNRSASPGGFPTTLQNVASTANVQFGAAGGASTLAVHWGTPNLQLTGAVADLAAATAATINQIRTAVQIQKLYERDARGGTRYTEVIRAHFGVTSPDARQQRPEFLGGGAINISMNPVPATTGSSAVSTAPLGTLAAYGTAVGSTPTIIKSFTEHSVILGLVSVRADLNYQQGVPRMYNRRTKYDFYWPALSHLGEQAVLSREIYTDGTGTPANGLGDYSVWGYQERWAEYRYKPSLITGQLRSSDPGTLDSWHLAQNFGSRPLLNAAYIVEDPPIARTIAVPTAPHFILDGHFKFHHIRPMPTYSVPGLMDHF